MALESYTIWVPTLLLVVVRLIGLVLTAPTLAHASVPFKLRLAAAIVISLAVVARMADPIPPPVNAGEFLLAGGTELLIGAAMGYAATLIFVGLQLGAFHASQQMGLSLAEVFDPLTAEASGVIRSTFGILAIAIFLSIGGLRSLIGAMLRTFETLPPATGLVGAGMLNMAVAMLAASFTLAIKVACPLLIAMLLATVAMGLLQKTLPQCNLFSTHLPIRAFVGLLVLAASIGILRPLLETSVDFLVDRIGLLAAGGVMESWLY